MVNEYKVQKNTDKRKYYFKKILNKNSPNNEINLIQKTKVQI